MKMVSLKCQNCSASLDVDAEHMLAKCPYCGNTNLIEEDKDITMRKIESKERELEIDSNQTKFLVAAVVVAIIVCIILLV